MKILNYELPNMEQLVKLGQSIKSTAITLMATGAACIGTMGAFKAVTLDSVVVEPLKVPRTFEEFGFNSEVATARLLDEINTYGRSQSSSAKERVSILSKSHDNDLDKLSTKSSDVKIVQDLIQDALGIQKQRITGEITYKQDADDATPAGRTYHIRLRKLPGNTSLLDMTAKGEPQEVLQKAALGMIEVFDPHIAASIYWRNRDEANALRMIDVVLHNNDPTDDKYSLNLRGYIHISHKELDAAWSMFERVQKTDPDFAPSHSLASWVHLERKQFPESIAEADKVIALASTKYWGYFSKARALRDSKQSEQAIALFRQALILKPDAPQPYIQAANFFNVQKLPDEAMSTAKRGLQLFPQSEALEKLVSELQTPKPEK
jgi:tetratricopeptide (TPR) repeat protein